VRPLAANLLRWLQLRGAIVALMLRGLPATAAEPLKGTPPLPAPRSPVQTFRELLAAPVAQRQAYLVRKSPAARELIEAKLTEFESLSGPERELRLELAQLQYFLSPLLAVEPPQRGPLLAAVPEELRTMIGERLRAWDALAPEARREIRESEQSLSHFIRLETADAGRLAAVVAGATAAARPEVEAQLQRWLALSAEERARKTAGFRQFLNLTDRERARTLKRLDDTDRARMEATLASFEQLPPAQRQRCVEAFRQFASFTPERRAEFLRDAEKWQALSAAERAAWRRLVERAAEQPPLPEPPWPIRPALVTTNAP
jgi:hypothetical protein